MEISTLVAQLVLIAVSCSFILIGVTLNELDILQTVSSLRNTDLDGWREFLLPYIYGIPEPNN